MHTVVYEGLRKAQVIVQSILGGQRIGNVSGVADGTLDDPPSITNRICTLAKSTSGWTIRTVSG